MADEPFMNTDEGIEDKMGPEPTGDISDNVQTIGRPPADPYHDLDKSAEQTAPPPPAPEKDGWLKRLGKHLLGRDPDEIDDPDQALADVLDVRRRADEHRAAEARLQEQMQQEELVRRYSEQERQLAKFYADVYGQSEDPFLAMARAQLATSQQNTQQIDQIVEQRLAQYRAREDALSQFQTRRPELSGAASTIEALGQLVEAASGYQLTPDQRIQVGERIVQQLLEKSGAQISRPKPKAVPNAREQWGRDVLEGTVGGSPARSAEDVDNEQSRLISGALQDMFG